MRAKPIYDAIADHKVTHLSGAPFVMSTAAQRAEPRKAASLPAARAFNHAAAPPPDAVLGGDGRGRLRVTHLYGLTETYGPATLNEWHAEWDELRPNSASTSARARACATTRSKAST